MHIILFAVQMAAYGPEPNESYLNLKRRFSDFIHEYQPSRGERYVDRLEPIFENSKQPGKDCRLLIDINDLHQFDDKLHGGLLKDPAESLRPCVDAARDIASGLQNGQFGQKHADNIQVPSCRLFLGLAFD